VRLTRRQALAGAAASALSAAGIYELVDRLSGEAPKRAAGTPHPPEQHLLDSIAVIEDNGVEVVVPPLHHRLVTAKVRAGDLRSARRQLNDALAELDRRYEPTPAGLGVTVGWGLPYFARHVPAASLKQGISSRRVESAFTHLGTRERPG